MLRTIFLFPFILLVLPLRAQELSSRLKFSQGQTFEITLQVKSTIAQQAMGQAIDFTVNAEGVHAYKVTNSTDENSTLQHYIKHINFSFDGMGQKRNFDSRNDKDLNSAMGKPVKDMLSKQYNMIVDTAGRVLMAVPEKIQLAEGDSRMAIVTSMLKDVFDLVQPPEKGKGSLFSVLPPGPVAIGTTWTSSYVTESGKFDEAYRVNSITDSTILVDFTGTSLTITKAEMMGNTTTTTMNNKSSGTIVLDRATGLLREKNGTTESNGNTEASFGTLPVTSKTVTTVRVKAME